MSIIVMTADDASGLAQQPWPIIVDVDGRTESQLALLSCTAGLAGDGITATFEWVGRSANFGFARQIAPRGRRIRARQLRLAGGTAFDWPIFDGHIVGVRAQFSGQTRRLLIDAIDGVRFICEGLTLAGIHSLDSTGRVVADSDEPLAFNAAGRPNRSPEQVETTSRPCHVFDFSNQACFWSAADIANYLIATRLLDRRIVWPAASRLELLSGAPRPHSLDLTGVWPLDALQRLAELTDCSFAIEPVATVRTGGQWRVSWFANRGRRTVAVHHQPAGEPVAGQTNVAAASLDFEHDNVRRVWIAVGERERVESTFSLVAGWSDAAAIGSHREFSRANPRFAEVRDVHRRWVLNEAGDWSGEPFNRPPADLSELFGDSDCLLRRRRFRPTLSCDPAGRSFGVLVEVSYDSGATWVGYRGRIEVLADEAGIWIADDELPPDYWQAATAGTLAVRATATIECDSRVRAELVHSPRADVRRTVRRVCRPAGRFRRQWVANSSLLFGTDADEIDDRAKLADALDACRQRDLAGATRGRLTLPWLSGVYQVGDRVAGIDGQGLSFESADQCPLIRTVRHELGEQYQTTLELE